MRRMLPLAALLLAACSEMAGVGASAALKGHQGASAAEYEKAIARRLAADPALAGLKVSVALANHWRDGFSTHVSVLVAGTAPDQAAQARAAQTIRETIGGAPEATAILDLSRIENPHASPTPPSPPVARPGAASVR